MQIVTKNTKWSMWSWKETKIPWVVAAGTLSWVCITSYQLIYSMITTSALTSSQLSRTQPPKGDYCDPSKTNGWNLENQRKITFQTSIFGFHVSLRECNDSCCAEGWCEVLFFSKIHIELAKLFATTFVVTQMDPYLFLISKTTFEKPVLIERAQN